MIILDRLGVELVIVKCLNKLSNNGSFDLLAENLKLKQTNKQLFQALVNLVNLKIHKETFGKTEYYEQYKEFAWDNAKELIKLIGGYINGKI